VVADSDYTIKDWALSLGTEKIWVLSPINAEERRKESQNSLLFRHAGVGRYPGVSLLNYSPRGRASHNRIFAPNLIEDCGRRALAAKGLGLLLILNWVLIYPSRSGLPRSADRVGKRDVLFEGEARVSHPADSIEHRREPEGQACGCSFFWEE